MFTRYVDGVVAGVYGCPQPDALDENGDVICAGVETVWVPDDHPDVIAFSELLKKVPEQNPTLDDVIAVLRSDSSLAAKLDARKK